MCWCDKPPFPIGVKKTGWSPTRRLELFAATLLLSYFVGTRMVEKNGYQRFHRSALICLKFEKDLFQREGEQRVPRQGFLSIKRDALRRRLWRVTRKAMRRSVNPTLPRRDVPIDATRRLFDAGLAPSRERHGEFGPNRLRPLPAPWLRLPCQLQCRKRFSRSSSGCETTWTGVLTESDNLPTVVGNGLSDITVEPGTTIGAASSRIAAS